MHTLTRAILFFIVIVVGSAMVFAACQSYIADAPRSNTNGSQPMSNSESHTTTPASGETTNTTQPDKNSSAHAATESSTAPSSTASPASSSAPSANESSSDDLALTASISADGQGALLVSYKVTNRGKAPVLLLNQGDTSLGLGAGRVYIEPQADGSLDLTQRAFNVPSSAQGPTPFAAIYPGVTTLAPGKTMSQQLKVLPPLTRRHPYMNSSPNTPMPNPIKRVRFCLGVIEATDVPTKLGSRGVRVLTSLQSIASQRLLCSPTQELR